MGPLLHFRHKIIQGTGGQMTAKITSAFPALLKKKVRLGMKIHRFGFVEIIDG